MGLSRAASHSSVPDAPPRRPRDELRPQHRWVFDQDVTRAFDDMLERSIPQYEVMRSAVNDLAVSFLELGEKDVVTLPLVLDLGCSRGEAIARLLQTARARSLNARFVGVDASDAMLEAARQRFAGEPNVDVVQVDLRQGYPVVAAARVTLSVLTLQFIPIEYRQSVLKRIYEHTAKGGCLILVEKVLGKTAQLNDMMVARYLDMKRANGYSEEQIIRKRLALEGVLVPITASRNEELLTRAGFEAVDCFWRWMNFAAWAAVRTA
jgi:tRNA (cmo5U34)-methyltransferase